MKKLFDKARTLNWEDWLYIAILVAITIGGIGAIGFWRTLVIHIIGFLGSAEFEIKGYRVALGDSLFYWMFCGFLTAILILTAV